MRGLFNTAMESSIRSLVVLNAIDDAVDLDLLVLYDYFLVHSGDYPSGPASLHPPVPHRSGELLVRRDLVRAGLEFAQKKSLIELQFTDDGVLYAPTGIASAFLGYFQSRYYEKLRERADWMAEKLYTSPREELVRLVENNLEEWAADNAQFLMAPTE